MSGLAVSRHVEHHQTFLGNGRLHAGRLAYKSYIYLRQQWQNALHAVLSAYFFFGTCQKDEVVKPALLFESGKDMEQRDQTGAIVVGAKPIDAAAFTRCLEGIALPSGNRLHGVDVGIQQERLFLRSKVWLHRPQIVARTMYLEPEFALHIVLQEVGSRRLFTADAWHFDKPAKQIDCFLCYPFVEH